MLGSHRPSRLLFALITSPVLSASTCQPHQTIHLALGYCVILSNEGDIYSWGLRTGVQNSGEVCAVPSTVVNSTFLTSSEICAEDQLDVQDIHTTKRQCRSKRGGYVVKDKLSLVPTDGLAELNPGWGALDNIITEAANATLKLGRRDIQTIAPLFSDGNVSVTSHLGLAAGSTLLQDLHRQGVIGSRSWGLNSGSQSERFPRPGSLVLGGYDEGSLAGPFHEFDVKVPDKLETRHCPLQVTVTGLTVEINNTNQTQPVTKELISNANKMVACLEPYDNQFRMPGPVLSQIQSIFREVTQYPGDPVAPSEYVDILYNVEPGIVYPRSAGLFNATLRFTLDYRLVVDIPYYEIQRPLRGLNSDGKLAVAANYTELQIYSTPAEADAPVLGKAFLSQLYLHVDYETMRFFLAAQNTAVVMPSPVATHDSNCAAKSPGLSPKDRAFIAVGVILGVVVLSLFGLWTYRRLHRDQPTQEPTVEMVVTSSSITDRETPREAPEAQGQNILEKVREAEHWHK